MEWSNGGAHRGVAVHGAHDGPDQCCPARRVAPEVRARLHRLKITMVGSENILRVVVKLLRVVVTNYYGW